MIKLETGRGPCVKSGGPLDGNVRECDVENQHLQGYNPHLCRLRTDGLAPRLRIERTDRILVLWA
jgi:hypothetical protein